MSDDQVLVISSTVTFALIKNFSLALPTKFLNKINKTTKLSQKFSYFSFPLFYAECQFIQGAKQHLQKHFVLYFRMCYFKIKKY